MMPLTQIRQEFQTIITKSRSFNKMVKHKREEEGRKGQNMAEFEVHLQLVGTQHLPSTASIKKKLSTN